MSYWGHFKVELILTNDAIFQDSLYLRDIQDQRIYLFRRTAHYNNFLIKKLYNTNVLISRLMGKLNLFMGDQNNLLMKNEVLC